MAKKMRRVLALVLALVLCAGKIGIPAFAQTVTGTGTPEDPKITVTVTIEEDGSKTTNSNSVWESVDVETGGSITEGNPSVEVTTDITTTVKGSEDTQQNISHDSKTNIETITGSLEGKETTTVEGTTITTTTTIGELITEETSADNPVEKDLTGSDVTVGDWVEGTPTDNAWDEGELAEGEADEGTTQITSSATVELKDPENVTLNLKPGGTDTKTIHVTLEDVSSGAYTLPTGDDYVVEELKVDGKLVGWTVTHKSTTSTADTPYETVTGETKETQVGNENKVVVKPAGYTVGETTEGNVKTIVEEILDDNGNFKGYKVTKITTTESDNSDNPDITESGRDTTATPAEESENFTLPEKPQESVTTNEYGGTTTVTVEDLIQDGKHVGYKTTAVTTSADGEVMYTETKSIYGTTSAKTTVTQADPETEEKVTTTKVTTTEVEEIYTVETTRNMELKTERVERYETTIVTDQDTYQLVQTEDGGMYFLYQGKMYAVQGTNTVTENLDVATNDTVAMSGYTDTDDVRVKGETVKGEKGEKITVTTHYTGQTPVSDGKGDGKWTHVGYGLYSDFVLTDSEGTAHSAKQFAIMDGDTIRYVYCVEMGAGIAEGTFYSSTEYTEDNDNKAPWAGASGTVEQLRSVALNGYWGTESGLGSLAAVKDLMIRNGLEKEAENLSVGMAVAATQAAIWEFGSEKGVEFDGQFVTYDDERGKAPTEADQATIVALRDLLVKLANDKNGAGVAEVIDASDITGASITLESKATDDAGNVKTDEAGNELYKSDLSFKLEVSTSSLNGDLLLEIIDENGREIAKHRLVGENSNWLSFAKITPDENGVYTIEDVELAEGVVVTLKLSGIQHLDDGVFIYEGANNKQDFIGLSRKENNVDITVNLEFNVEDPEIERISSTTTQLRTDTKTDTKTDTRTDTKLSTQNVTSGNVVTVNTHNVKVYGTITVTETEKEITKEERAWEAGWQYLLTVIDGDDGGDDDDDDLIEILDEEVPLADVPKTGDISALWAAMSLISLGGLAVLKKKREED